MSTVSADTASRDPRIHEIRARLTPLRERLLGHPVYTRLRDLAALRAFCSHHVFAVWDFMSLLKTLQTRLTTTAVPWIPSPHGDAVRLINEIVVGEECDHAGPGAEPGVTWCSHLELYLAAARDLGTPLHAIEHLVAALRSGTPWRVALEETTGVPPAARAFVGRTLELCENGETWEVAADFVLGRENLIPDMFGAVSLDIAKAAGAPCDRLAYYLDRHVELDGEEHGPASERLLADLCGDDPQRWSGVQRIAEEALKTRISLWDAVVASL